MARQPIHFQYRAFDAEGRTVSGFADAFSEGSLKERLAGRGLTLTETNTVGAAARALRNKRVKPKHLIAFTYQFGALWAAGVPLLTAFDDLARATESPTLRAILTELESMVRAGAPLSRSMRQFPGAFSELYVAMIEAGETSGMLEPVLNRLGQFLDWTEETRQHARTAMIYPCVLAAAVLGLIVILLTVLIPRLRGIYDTAGVQLPLPTRVVLAVSDFATTHWAFLLGGTVLLAVLAAVGLSTKRGRRWLDGLVLRLPLLGDLVRKICAARFTATLSSMLESGVPIARSLEVVAPVVGNQLMEDAIHVARVSVQRGEQLGDTLERSGIFQPLVISMIRSGERTGGLATSLTMVNRFYDREVPQTVKRFLALLEPAMIVVAGIIVGFIVASALLPIYRIAQALGTGR